MKTIVFERVLFAIGYWIHSNERAIRLLLNPKQHLVKNFLEPFKKELNANLLTRETAEGKKDIIIYYMFEFVELQSFFKEFDSLLMAPKSNVRGSTSKYIIEEKGKPERRADSFENYVIVCQELFGMIACEIQLCCFKYKIDLISICNDLKIDTPYLELSIYEYLVSGYKNNNSSEFASYLTSKKPKLLSFLRKNYTNTKPEIIAYMIFALVDLKLLDRSILANQSKLHQALSRDFRRIGTRQNLSYNIGKLNAPDEYRRKQIDVIREEIRKGIA